MLVIKSINNYYNQQLLPLQFLKFLIKNQSQNQMYSRLPLEYTRKYHPNPQVDYPGYMPSYYQNPSPARSNFNYNDPDNPYLKTDQSYYDYNPSQKTYPKYDQPSNKLSYGDYAAMNRVYSDTPPTISALYNQKPEVKDMTPKILEIQDQMSKNSYSYSQMVENLIQYLNEMILCEVEIEILKGKLWSYQDFNLKPAYQWFKYEINIREISKQDFIAKLKELGYETKKSDIDLFFRRLSFNSFFFGELDFQKMCEPRLQKNQDLMELQKNHYQECEFSESTGAQLARLIKMIIQGQSLMEYIRQNLEKNLCDMTYCFDYMDRNHKGLISEIDFVNFFKSNNVPITNDEAYLLVCRLDQLGNGYVNLNQFIQEFIPQSNATYYIP